MKILIIRLGAFGDIIHTLPITAHLKLSNPKINISWLIYDQYASLLNNHPNIDTVYKITKNKLFSIIPTLRQENFDYILDMQGLLKTSLLSKFISCLSSSQLIGLKPTRESLASYLYDRSIPSTPILDPNRHIIERNLDILNLFDITDKPSLTNDSLFGIQHTPQKYPELPENFIVCTTQTLWKSKIWTHWDEYLNKLTQNTPYKIIVVGKEKETFSNKNIINLTSQTSLPQLTYIISRAKLVVAGDTGMLHLAAGLNVPCIGLFGATSLKRTGAWQQVNLSANANCSPCHKRVCPLNKDKYMQCMNNLQSETILQATLEILNIT